MFATIIGIAVGMFFIYGEYKKLNQKGVECINNPLAYAGNIMEEKQATYAIENLDDGKISCEIIREQNYFTP